MRRRCFSKGLAAAGLMTGARADARERSEGRDGFPAFGQIWIDGSGRPKPGIPVRFVVVSDNFNHEIGADFRFPMSNEQRIGVLTPTLQRQFRARVQIGEVRVDSGRTIWIRATVPVLPNEIRLTDFEISFRINGKKLARRYTGRVPNLSSMPLIGQLFRRSADTRLTQSLMVLVRPRVLHYAE